MLASKIPIPVRQLQTPALRTLTTGTTLCHPRIRRRSAINSADFGSYERITPASLVPCKPQPTEPSLASIPAHIDRPPYAKTGMPPAWPSQIPTLAKEQIERLREASRVARDALALGRRMVRAGVTTAEIDAEMHKYIVSQNGYPSCLNYMGFPKAVCTSVNNVIAHGIPDSRPLVNGDFINLDVTVFKHGFHGDTSATFAVGHVDDKGVRLMQATEEALDLAIQACGPGVPFSAIGGTIGAFAQSLGYSVSEELTGHGIGQDFHQNPLIYHHVNSEPGVMLPGMAFTIEPILCQGVARGVQWPDGWTITTEDGGRSAQYEHTLVITDSGVDVLTKA
ncbi:hypothetical protein FB645_003537 [Coemansia sp. IMI 203386]|nr:hypothetical protein FB645_003537 [Coemansia sp. IMI 203386]